MNDIPRYEDGWRKIGERGGSLVVADLYNIATGETDSVVVRDYEYSDCSRDCDSWYNMPIDQNALTAYKRSHGIIFPGCKIMVIAGRKVPRGTVATVEKLRAVKDRYGRHVADYAILDNGQATNVENCVMIM